MAFLDKIFRWKKKPFGEGGAKSGKSDKSDKGKEAAGTSSTSSSSATPERGSGQFSNVIIRPHSSEKAVTLSSINQYVFEVAISATKQDVSRAVRDLYGVVPEEVNMIRQGGKQLRFGRTEGTTKSWKKAMVTLPPGSTIELYKK